MYNLIITSGATYKIDASMTLKLKRRLAKLDFRIGDPLELGLFVYHYVCIYVCPCITKSGYFRS